MDVGARGYNNKCKELINSTKTEYWQIEPNPPGDRSEMRNDGFLEMYMQDVPQRRSDLAKSFDIVIDFGVFGWDGVQTLFDDKDIQNYMDGVRFLLKDEGLWALKTEKGWVPDEKEFVAKWILPYFDQGKFDIYESGHSIKRGNFRFWWFYKKQAMGGKTT